VIISIYQISSIHRESASISLLD